ncbi:hypothetical protein PR202_ga22461 [Eleusine coracana subsp. coracana]|uniref:Uncharacterized protein n=1 Tax=Eleusine coracana subsp. coracana TaxID=191504 RepID=A0AAV5D3K6_ELECO|nr:hypothetical protein PR202_ga22461 [Eleusine coracana subsp. coracana]
MVASCRPPRRCCLHPTSAIFAPPGTAAHGPTSLTLSPCPFLLDVAVTRGAMATQYDKIHDVLRRPMTVRGFGLVERHHSGPLEERHHRRGSEPGGAPTSPLRNQAPSCVATADELGPE